MSILLSFMCILIVFKWFAEVFPLVDDCDSILFLSFALSLMENYVVLLHLFIYFFIRFLKVVVGSLFYLEIDWPHFCKFFVWLFDSRVAPLVHLVQKSFSSSLLIYPILISSKNKNEYEKEMSKLSNYNLLDYKTLSNKSLISWIFQISHDYVKLYSY